MTNICNHLSIYADSYERTTVNYKICLDLMDRILGGDILPSLLSSLERSLNDWELENRQLREQFESLVHKGAIQLPTVDGESVPPGQGSAASTCAVCGEEVPRLEFPEWNFTEDGMVQFRGQDLLATEPQPA